MPYYVAAFFAAAVMAWYFFVFVPAKLDYFVGLRLRTLAVASGQVKTQIETLAGVLAKAGTLRTRARTSGCSSPPFACTRAEPFRRRGWS
jgi:hypothetical protein